MSWNHTPIQSCSYQNIEEFYNDDLKYSWGNKYTILDHKITGKKKGKLFELIKNKETNEVFANLTLVEVEDEEVSYKTIGLDHSIPVAFAKKMTPKYKTQYDELMKRHKEDLEKEKARKESFKNIQSGQIVKMNSGHVVEFGSKFSARTFVGKLHNNEDVKNYSWSYKDIISIL